MWCVIIRLRREKEGKNECSVLEASERKLTKGRERGRWWRGMGKWATIGEVKLESFN